MEKGFNIYDCDIILDRFYKQHRLETKNYKMDTQDERELNSLVDRINPLTVEQYPDIVCNAIKLSSVSRNANAKKINEIAAILEEKTKILENFQQDERDFAIAEYVYNTRNARIEKGEEPGPELKFARLKDGKLHLIYGNPSDRKNI